MPRKDPVARAEYYQQYHKAHNKGSHLRRKEVWRSFLREVGLDKCSICGYNKSTHAIDFHHTDHSTKEFNMAHLTSRAFTPFNISKFLVELEKCQVLCANCHREAHQENKEG
jgi:hypothetical protein